MAPARGLAQPYASTTVIGGAEHLWQDGQWIVASLVFSTAVIAPALQIAFMLAIAVGAHRERPPRWVGTLLRHHPTSRLWSMIEVMMLGVLVALRRILGGPHERLSSKRSHRRPLDSARPANQQCCAYARRRQQ